MDRLCVILFLLRLFEARSVNCPKHCVCETRNGNIRCTLQLEIPRIPPECVNVDLSDNAVINLKREDFEKNTHIEKLWLRSNKISEIDKDTFYDLTDLELIDITDNNLRFLDENMFGENRKLKHLNLNNNVKLNFSTSKLPDTLEKLYIKNTSVRFTLDEFKKYPKLRWFEGMLRRDDYDIRQTEPTIRMDVKNNKVPSESTSSPECDPYKNIQIIKTGVIVYWVYPIIAFVFLFLGWILGTYLPVKFIKTKLWRDKKEAKPETESEQQTLTEAKD